MGKETLYSYVQDTIDSLNIDQFVTIDMPEKLPSFRKYLSEIGKTTHKKFTTKVRGNNLHIMRIKYHSLTEKIESNV